MSEKNMTEKLPEGLKKLRDEFPSVSVSELPAPVIGGASGLLDHMESASCVMYQLGQLLWATGEKFRVTIECDPETGIFEAKRETIA